MDSNQRKDNSVYADGVPAGRRKYFFDVRTTRDADHFLTITERKDGLRHTIHIYKEDVIKFQNALNDCIKEMRAFVPNLDDVQFERRDDHDQS